MTKTAKFWFIFEPKSQILVHFWTEIPNFAGIETGTDILVVISAATGTANVNFSVKAL